MKKIIKLSESDLTRIVKRIISEQSAVATAASVGTPSVNQPVNYSDYRPCKPGESGKLVQQGKIFALSNGRVFCRIVS
jgi:hypothetical protein